MEKQYKILVLYYSQTGKSEAILDVFLEPLRDQPNIIIDEVEIKPTQPYPFPWPKLYFFSIFPECAYEVPTELEDMQFDENDEYDLIILGTQVWFLSISIPFVSFLKHTKSKVINNKPVITVLSCRKMWLCTQQRLEEYVFRLGGKLVGKVLVTAQGDQMKTLKATKDNLFEEQESPGKEEWLVSESVLQQTRQQGMDLLEAIRANRVAGGNLFSVASEAFADMSFAHPEKVAKRSFLFWGKGIIKLSKEKSLFRYFLTTIFLSTFFLKVFIGLPMWPIVRRFKEKQGQA